MRHSPAYQTCPGHRLYNNLPPRIVGPHNTQCTRPANHPSSRMQQDHMDSLPEWSKGVDSSSTSESCVGSNPTAVICFSWQCACARRNAETRDRAGDLQIFSLTLSQLSYRGLRLRSASAACVTSTRCPRVLATTLPSRGWPARHDSKKCRDPGSSRGPSDLQSDALPAELSRPSHRQRRVPTCRAPPAPPRHDHAQGLSCVEIRH